VPSPLDEVLEALRALLDAREEIPEARPTGAANFRCEGCEDCNQCRFCTDCTACDDCTYCERCQSCVSCTHCKDCERCEQLTHASWSAECSESSYLSLCVDCENCVQCFACVGLSGEEFRILNEKVSRKTYFSRVAALRGALLERLGAGWRPPWSEPEPEPEPETPLAPSSEDLQPKAAASPWLRDLGELTVDTDEPSNLDPRGTPPWSFSDVRPQQSTRELPPIDETLPPRPELLPDPPPYDASPFREPSDEPSDESRQDRYGWTAQAEGNLEPLPWPSFEDDPPRPGREPSAPRSEPNSRKRETRDNLPSIEPDLPIDRPRTRRGELDWPELDSEFDGARDSHADDFDRRRRETAANPSSTAAVEEPRPPRTNPPVAAPEPPSLALDAWSPYDALDRARLGPDEQTEPDAPIARRGRDRAEISGAAREPEPIPEPEGKGPARARRPTRPPADSPTRTGLLRGRAPARPTAPPARQPDAPSIRHARRPARGSNRDETPTAPYPVGDSKNPEPEPGS